MNIDTSCQSFARYYIWQTYSPTRRNIQTHPGIYKNAANTNIKLTKVLMKGK